MSPYRLPQPPDRVTRAHRVVRTMWWSDRLRSWVDFPTYEWASPHGHWTVAITPWVVVEERNE